MHVAFVVWIWWKMEMINKLHQHRLYQMKGAGGSGPVLLMINYILMKEMRLCMAG